MAAAFYFLLAAAAALVALSTNVAEAATVEYQFDVSYITSRMYTTMNVQFLLNYACRSMIDSISTAVSQLACQLIL